MQARGKAARRVFALGQSTTVTPSIAQAQATLLADGKYTAPVQFVNATSGVGTPEP